MSPNVDVRVFLGCILAFAVVIFSGALCGTDAASAGPPGEGAQAGGESVRENGVPSRAENRTSEKDAGREDSEAAPIGRPATEPEREEPKRSKVKPADGPDPKRDEAAVSAPANEPPKEIEGMVYVPAGVFLAGSDEGGSDEAPMREVYLAAFYMDAREVTNREYKAFVDATGHRPPVSESDPAKTVWHDLDYPPEFADHPVVNVSWEDAAAYARWRGKRLPTEFEWEKAARGADGRTYPWGEKRPTRARCNVGGKGTMPIGTNPMDLSVFGCYDMAGNVAEWTGNWYEAYPGSMYESGDYGQRYRVVRGGAWHFAALLSPRCSARERVGPHVKSTCYGFRCAQDAP